MDQAIFLQDWLDVCTEDMQVVKVSAYLSILLCHSFPSLNSLILSHCGLNSQDLCSLEEARVERRLPKLTQLDLSENNDLIDNCESLFSFHAEWDTLTYLIITQFQQVSNHIFTYLMEKATLGCLRSLQHLKVSVFEAKFLQNAKVENLQDLHIYVRLENFATSLSNVVDAIHKETFPNLMSIKVTRIHERKDLETWKKLQNEVKTLQKAIEGKLPDKVVGQIIGSLPNIMENFEAHTHVELTNRLMSQPFDEQIIRELFNTRSRIRSQWFYRISQRTHQ